MKENYTKICQAKVLLNLEELDPQKLENLEEEVTNLREVWTELGKVWANIEALWDIPLNAVVPKKIR